MDIECKIVTVLSMTDDADEDLIPAYLDIAAQEIVTRAYPFRNDVTEVPAKYEVLQCRIAAFLINKRGAEGQTGHTENGVSRSYGGADLPDELTKQIVPFAGGFA